MVGKPTTVFEFWKKKNANNSKINSDDATLITIIMVDIPTFEYHHTKFWQIKINEIDIGSLDLECNPELYMQIWDYQLINMIKCIIKRLFISFLLFRFCKQKESKSTKACYVCEIKGSEERK